MGLPDRTENGGQPLTSVAPQPLWIRGEYALGPCRASDGGRTQQSRAGARCHSRESPGSSNLVAIRPSYAKLATSPSLTAHRGLSPLRSSSHCAAQPLGQHGTPSQFWGTKGLDRKTHGSFDYRVRQFVQWRAGLIARLSRLDVAARKRVEQEPPGKKNEIMALDSVNARILLDSH